jgi:hypothetical protein
MTPRLLAAGADMKKVIRLKKTWEETESGEKTPHAIDMRNWGVQTMETAYQMCPDLKLVIIDPIAAYLGGANDNSNVEVRAALDPLAAWAAERKVAILLLHHLNKNDKTRAAYRAVGSIGFTAVVRMAWAVADDYTDPKKKLMTLVMGNIAPDAKTMRFEIQPTKVTEKTNGALVDTCVISLDDKLVDATAQEILAPDVLETLQSSKHKAARFLKSALMEGAVPCMDLYKEAEGEGITKRTLDRAKKALDIKTKRMNGKWYWTLFE